MSSLYLILIALGLLLLLGLGAALLARRRRAAAATDDSVPLPIPSGEGVDYTSLTEEQPVGWRQRLAQMPPGRRAGLALVGALVLGLLAALIWGLSGATGGSQVAQTTPVPPGEITRVDAIVSSPDEIAVTARSNLPDGTQVAAELTADGQPFAWYTTESASGQVDQGKIDLKLKRAPEAPLPEQGKQYTVIIVASDLAGTRANVDLVIPPTYTDAFFGVVPTPAPAPAATARPQPTTTAPTAVAEVPSAAPGAPVLTASVFNGGNVREQPSREGRVIGGINAGETVTLTQKTDSGDWFFLETVRGERGWSSATLLTIAEEVAAQVPLLGQGAPVAVPTPGPTPDTAALTASVFNGGNVREQPNLSSRVVGGLVAGENVTLLQKTASGQWYRVRTPRNEEGWCSVTLLTISTQVRDQVPVAGAAPPTDGAAPPTDGGTGGDGGTAGTLTASVFNGGNVRDQPVIAGKVVGGINAGESVTLLQKTADGQWYRLRTVRNEEGWASATLLTISAGVAAQVPVAP